MRTRLTGRLSLLFVSFAMLLAIPAIAFADDIYNNLDGSIDANVETIGLTAGGSNGNVNLQVDATNGDGKNGCNLTGSSSLSASVISSDATVATVSPGSVTFTSCGEIKALAVSPLKAGETTISLRQSSNTTGGTFNLAPATFKVVVAPAAPTQKDTGLAASSASGTYGGTTSLSATLSSSSTGVGGKSVDFTLNGNAVGSATTSSSGVATLTGVSLSGINAGTYADAVVANFAGDTGYKASLGSNALTVNKAAGSVSINDLPSAAVFGGSFTPEYTKSGDGTASTTSNTPDVCSVNAGVVSFDAAGTCKLQASVAAGTNHLGTSGAEQTFQIAKAAATLSLNGLTGHTYNGQTQGATVATSPAGLQGASISYSQNGQTVAGPTNAGSYDVVASLDNPNYQATNANGTMVIAKANPQITWSNPTDITYGTQLGAAQLNASADVAGSFSYTPASGTKLDVGADQDLRADFTPGDTGNYNPASKTVQINVQKANQSIDFGALAAKTYGDAPFTVTASADSGDAVSFSADGNCTVEGGTVNITGAGNCTITASQAGNANYNAATDVSRSFAIAKAEASINLSGLGKTYNGSAQGATATTTPADLSGLSVTYDGSAQAPTNAGSYHVIAELSNPNYEAQEATGTLVIAKAQAQVDLSNLSQTYDGTVKAASASTTPTGLNVDFVYSQNDSAATPRNAGSYRVVATVDNTNYEGQATGTLIINKAQATIDLSDLNQVYNGSPRAITVNTTPDVPNKQLTVTYDGEVQAPTNAGSYHVVASLNDANYEARDATGTLTIAKAQARVDLSNLSQTYDGSPRDATVSTTPANLDVDVSYEGNAQAPTNAGSYQVEATVNEANYEGSARDTLVIAKARQTITFAPLATRTLGDADFAVSAQGGNSGNPVTFAATGSCTISGSTVHITGVGNCAITASQAGNGNYLDAAPVKQSFGTNYKFAGYRQPVDNNNVLNTAKAGSAIPMKFSLFGNQGLNIFSTAVSPNPKVTKVSCAAGTTTDALEEYAAATNSGLTYDATADQYNYVWKTQSAYAGSCYKFDMVLLDGTHHEAYFKFTK